MQGTFNLANAIALVSVTAIGADESVNVDDRIQIDMRRFDLRSFYRPTFCRYMSGSSYAFTASFGFFVTTCDGVGIVPRTTIAGLLRWGARVWVPARAPVASAR